MQDILSLSDLESARLNYSLGMFVPVLKLNRLTFKNSIKNQFNLVGRQPPSSSIDPTSIYGYRLVKWLIYILTQSLISFCMSICDMVVFRLNLSRWLISSSYELSTSFSTDWSIATVKHTSISTEDRQMSIHSLSISSISVSKEKSVRNHRVVKYYRGKSREFRWISSLGNCFFTILWIKSDRYLSFCSFIGKYSTFFRSNLKHL